MIIKNLLTNTGELPPIRCKTVSTRTSNVFKHNTSTSGSISSGSHGSSGSSFFHNRVTSSSSISAHCVSSSRRVRCIRRWWHAVVSTMLRASVKDSCKPLHTCPIAVTQYTSIFQRRAPTKTLPWNGRGYFDRYCLTVSQLQYGR